MILHAIPLPARCRAVLLRFLHARLLHQACTASHKGR